MVVTGISGSGKSSLAFDTLFAEGQRRFAESLSSYARQFLGRMSKPDVEAIEGIPPAIAIEQKVNVRNPRSTVATTTEIYDYLRIIFARIGRTYSPVTGEEVKCHSVNDVMACILKGDARTAYILAPLGWKERTDKVELMLQLKEEGYSRFFCDGQIIRIEEVMKRAASGDYPEDLLLLVDRNRLPVMKGNLPWNDDGTPWPQRTGRISRLVCALRSTAFREGNGCLVVRRNWMPRCGKRRTKGRNHGIFQPLRVGRDDSGSLMNIFVSIRPWAPARSAEDWEDGVSEDLVVPTRL